MFEFKGKQYSQEQLQAVADRKGYTFDELLNKNPDIKEVITSEGKQSPTTQGAENVGVTPAPNTEFNLVNGSSESPKTSVRKKTRKSDLSRLDANLQAQASEESSNLLNIISTAATDEKIDLEVINNYYNLDKIENAEKIFVPGASTPFGGPAGYFRTPTIEEYLGPEKFEEYQRNLENGSIQIDETNKEKVRELENQAKYKLKKEAAQLYLRNVPENIQSKIDLNVFGEGKEFESYEDAVKSINQLNNFVIAESTNLEKDKLNYIEKTKPYTQRLNEINLNLEKLTGGALNGENLETESQINEYNALVGEARTVLAEYQAAGFNDVYNSIVERQEAYNVALNNIKSDEFKTKLTNIENAKILEDALSLDYSLSTRTAINLEEFFLGNMVGFGSLVGQTALEGLKVANPLAIFDEKGLKKIDNAIEIIKTSARNYNAKLAQKREETLPEAITLDDIGKNEVSFFDWFNEALANNSGSIVTTFIPGGLAAKGAMGVKAAFSAGAGYATKKAALQAQRKFALAGMRTAQGIFFTAEAGGKFSDLEQLEQAGLKNYSFAQKAFTSYAFGLIATKAETLGTLSYIQGAKNIAKELGKKQFKLAHRQSSLEFAKNNANKFFTTIPPVMAKNISIEMLEESVTQVGHNIVDNAVLDENKSIFEGINKDFLANTAVTSMGIMAPKVGGNIVNLIKNEFRTKDEVIANQGRVKELIEIRENIPNLKGEALKFARKRRNEIIQELALDDALSLQKLASMSEEQIQKVAEIKRVQRQVAKDMYSLGQSGDTSEAAQKAKENLRTQYNNLQEQADGLLNTKKVQNRKKLEELQKELGADFTNLESEYHLGLFDFYQNAAMTLMPKGGEYIVIEDINNIDEQLKGKLSDAAISEIKQGFAEGANGVNSGNNIIINKKGVELGIATSNFNADGKFAAAAPIHELFHIYNKAKNIVDKDGKLSEAATKAVDEAIEVLVDKKNLGEISEKDYNTLVNRFELYRTNKTGKIILKSGKRGAATVDGEEIMAAFNDAAALGILKPSDMTSMPGLKEFILGTASEIFGQPSWMINLETSNDVFNFIKNYQKSIQDKSAVQLPEEEKETQKFQEAEDLFAKTEEALGITKDEDGNTTWEGFDETKAILAGYLWTNDVNRRIQKYKNFANFNQYKDDIISDVTIGDVKGARGIVDIIRRWNPDKEPNIAKWINGQIENKILGVAQKYGVGKDFQLDVTESKGLAATETATEIVEQKETKAEADTEVKSLRKEIGLPDELVETVKQAVVKTFGTKLPNIEDAKFRLELQRRFRTELKKPIAKFVGTRANYENFLRDNFEAIYAKLPQSLLNKRFDEFIEPVLDKDGKQLREKTAEGNKIFTKKKISKAEFIKYFLGVELGSSTKGARKTTIVEAIAEEMAFDATMEVLNDPDIAQKYKDIAELTGKPLPENFKALVAKQVDRAEDFKFSKALSNMAAQEYNIGSQELGRILENSSIETLQKDYNLLYDNLVAEYNPKSIKFSLSTKAEGQWELSPMAEPDRFRNIYRFEVGEVGYDILTDRPEGISFEEFEDEVGLEQDAILQDRNSFGMMFLERKSGSTKTTGAGLQGLTNQFKVFGTVANATIDLIKRENLNSITFTAQGDSRTRLYSSLAQKFAKELGWDVYNWKDEDGVNMFIAYNPEAFGVEPEFTVTNPAPVKFTKAIGINAGDVANGTDAWINFADKHFEGSKILQEYIGSVEASLGSVRPSFLINASIIDGYNDLSAADKKKFDDAIKVQRKRIIGYQPKNKSSVRAEDTKYRKSHDIYGKKPSDIIDNILSGKTYEAGEAYSKLYTDMWGKYFDILADHPEMYEFLELSLATSNNDVSHWHRNGARFISYDPNPKPVTEKRRRRDGVSYPKTTYYVYEHAVQNHIVWKNLLKSAKELSKNKANKQKFLEGLAKVKEDYFMIALSVEDATKLDNAGYAHKMPENWKRFYDRYFNNKVAKYGKGIDPKKLKVIEYDTNAKKAFSDKSFADFYGIKNAKGDKETIKQSKSLSGQFNTFIEEKTGIDKRTKISEKRAAMIGEGKGRFKFFLPPNAEDFMGLLYTTLLPGKRGDEQIAFYKEQLVDPFARGIRNYQSAKEQTIRELKALKKAIKKVPTKLASKNETGFTNEVAVRVYLWNKNGYEVPGLKKKEVKDLVRVVANNSDLREFALNINGITRGNGYPEAENNWEAGTITTDLLEMLNTTTRKESLAEFINNKDQIFSKDNLNKLQAAFGKDYRFALEDALGRMVSGRKRYTGIDKDSKKFLDWLNGAVGTIMFWNSRSAILQMLSVVNYTNFSDNNIFNQVKTFANQKQYWTDWHTLMFSDFLKQRRAGSQLDVNINDIIEAAEGSTNPGKAIFAKLIRLGYAPTQIADSFAISTGGAAFYRNRINKYKKDGLSDQEAKDKAFLDFQEITEETQQSSRDDRISQIQAGGLGRIIFAFANTPMQYARIIKRASQDLINGRGDWRQNISRIAFYGFLQNIIFSTLQSGLFALLIDGDDDDEVIENKVLRALNNTADSLLRGSGLPGAVLSSVKNAVFEVFLELKKDRPQVWKAGLNGATSISPPVNSKVRKIVGALDRLSYKSTREDIMTKGLSLENPIFDIGGKLTSAITNAPADRLLRKTENIVAAMDEQTSATQALFLTAGWSKWDLNMTEKEPEGLKIKKVPIKKRKIKKQKIR